MTFCQHLNQNILGLKGGTLFNFAVCLNRMRVDELRKIKVYKYCTSFNFFLWYILRLNKILNLKLWDSKSIEIKDSAND